MGGIQGALCCARAQQVTQAGGGRVQRRAGPGGFTAVMGGPLQ